MMNDDISQLVDLLLVKVSAKYTGSNSFVLEDLDLLCRYLVMRFLKTTPQVFYSSDDASVKMNTFLESIYPALALFILAANSSPVTATEIKA